MSRILPFALLTAAVLALMPARAEPPLTLKSIKVELPDSGRTFSGPGSDAVNNHCLACHSAGMVLNQPIMPRAAWQTEVNKMIRVYKAPVAGKDVAAIVDYLTRAKSEK